MIDTLQWLIDGVVALELPRQSAVAAFSGSAVTYVSGNETSRNPRSLLTTSLLQNRFLGWVEYQCDLTQYGKYRQEAAIVQGA